MRIDDRPRVTGVCDADDGVGDLAARRDELRRVARRFAQDEQVHRPGRRAHIGDVDQPVGDDPAAAVAESLEQLVIRHTQPASGHAQLLRRSAPGARATGRIADPTAGSARSRGTTSAGSTEPRTASRSGGIPERAGWSSNQVDCSRAASAGSGAATAAGGDHSMNSPPAAGPGRVDPGGDGDHEAGVSGTV